MGIVFLSSFFLPKELETLRTTREVKSVASFLLSARHTWRAIMPAVSWVMGWADVGNLFNTSNTNPITRQ